MSDARTTTQQAWEYGYDTRERLVHALRKNDSALPQFRMAYAYDLGDNMTSQTKYNLTNVMSDSFADGNYTSSPAWTVSSGTWEVSSQSLTTTAGSGDRIIYTSNSTANSDVWFSFKRTGAIDYLLDTFGVKVRRIDANNYIEVMWGLGGLWLEEMANGVGRNLAMPVTNDYIAVDENVWYDVYVQLDGTNVALYAGTRDGGMKLLTKCTTNVAASTNRIEVRMNGNTPFLFDDFRVMSRAVDASQTSTFTYGGANQLTAMTSNGVTTNYTYDAWGRLATRSKVISGTTYTATYMWRYGDKLKRIDSTIPGELAMVRYDYNGLGKRMWRDTSSGDYTWWRWDLGWNVLAEYDDPDNDRVFEGFSKMFVPYGHSALAEAAVTTTPANAAYSYLAQDHLGTGRFVYNQSKTQTGAFEHYPYGARYNASGTAPYHEFTGKPWDAAASLYYFPYRYYRPDMERWTSTDPAGLVNGPNVYSFERGKVLNVIDPYGLSVCDYGCGILCALAAIIPTSGCITALAPLGAFGIGICTACSTAACIGVCNDVCHPTPKPPLDPCKGYRIYKKSDGTCFCYNHKYQGGWIVPTKCPPEKKDDCCKEKQSSKASQFREIIDETNK